MTTLAFAGEARAIPEVRVFAVTTAADATRAIARQLVRARLWRALDPAGGGVLMPPLLRAFAGQAPRLAPPYQAIGVSISHARGLSLLALREGGAIGVDLMRDDETPGELLAIARDYLGPDATRALAALPPTRRATAFAVAWTSFEARLKCLGLPLREWTPAVEQAIAACPTRPLCVPAGWTAAVAVGLEEAAAAVHGNVESFSACATGGCRAVAAPSPTGSHLLVSPQYPARPTLR